MTDIVTVYAPIHFDIYDSYGLIACEIVRNLEAIGVMANAVALGEAQHANQPPDVAAITRRPLRASFGGIVLGYPTGYDKYGPLSQVGARVAVTMFESSRIHPEWVDILNTLDAVVVPSQFCYESFIDCGVTTPIHVIPLGISETYQPYKRPYRSPFTFLAWMDRGKRKGGFHALRAFNLAFGDDPNYQLILKARENVTNINIINDNITLLQQDMTEAELYELYKSADCLVNPNLGEGFGLIPREFAATGGVTLATNWSGTADDIEKWGWPIPYTLKPADWRGIEKFQGVDLGDWAEPDVHTLADLMRDVADNYETYHMVALGQAENIHKLYSWREFTTAVYEIWREASYARYAIPAG